MTFTRFDAFKNAILQNGVSKPKYRLLRDHFHAEISSGRMAPGSALPTEAELCAMLKMSRNTVRQALGELENEGLVERFPGRGTFVTTEQKKRAQQQLNMFAVITPALNGPYPSLINGFEQTVTGFQHETIVGNSRNDIGCQADLIVRLVDQAVGGVALVPTTMPTTPAHQIRLLQKQHIPVVLCHRTVEGVSAPSVIYSGREVGLMAGRALHEWGHRRIAYTFSSQRYSMTEAYIEGIRETYSEASMDSTEFIVFAYETERPAHLGELDKSKQMLRELLGSPDRPTAIFCGNSPDAEVVYLEAIALGMSIPEDLSLIYVGSKQREEGLAKRISCIGIDEFQIGVQAARLLNEMRTGERPLDNDEQFVFPVELLPGETLGSAPDK